MAPVAADTCRSLTILSRYLWPSGRWLGNLPSPRSSEHISTLSVHILIAMRSTYLLWFAILGFAAMSQPKPRRPSRSPTRSSFLGSWLKQAPVSDLSSWLWMSRHAAPHHGRSAPGPLCIRYGTEKTQVHSHSSKQIWIVSRKAVPILNKHISICGGDKLELPINIENPYRLSHCLHR